MADTSALFFLYYSHHISQWKKTEIDCTKHLNPFPNEKILDSSKLEEFADDNFKFDKNGIMFSKQVENSGKKRNCSLRAISPFPTVFSEDLFCRHVKNQALFGKRLTRGILFPVNKGQKWREKSNCR